MTVNPEKRQLENHVHGAIAAQFWSQEVQSTRCVPLSAPMSSSPRPAAAVGADQIPPWDAWCVPNHPPQVPQRQGGGHGL
jgi:hypothetical protein